MERKSFGTSPFSDFDQMFEELRRSMDELMNRTYSFEQLDDEPVYVSYSRIDGPELVPVEELVSNHSGPRLMSAASSGEKEEPLIDVREKDGKVTVLVELPGICKEDIDLRVSGKNLVINVDVPTRMFSKEVPLPCAVKVNSTKASYRNGVLEVVLDRAAPRKRKGTKVKIE